MLRACRRVAKRGARMAFGVVSVAPDLSEDEKRRAVELGPEFVEAEAPYEVLLEGSGWQIVDRIDTTERYRRSAHEMLVETEARSRELTGLLGAAGLEELLVRRRATSAGVGEGLIRRDLFVANAV